MLTTKILVDFKRQVVSVFIVNNNSIKLQGGRMSNIWNKFQNIECWTEFLFLTKISIFGQNLEFL